MTTRPRLTPHQREVLGRLTRLSKHGRWVAESDIGSPAALRHLERKGFALSRYEYGPRGGLHYFWRIR